MPITSPVIFQSAGKEKRTERLSNLGNSDRYICEIAAMMWNLETNEVIEGVVDSDSNFKYLHNVTIANGSGVCVLLYQNGPPYEVGMLKEMKN